MPTILEVLFPPLLWYAIRVEPAGGVVARQKRTAEELHLRLARLHPEHLVYPIRTVSVLTLQLPRATLVQRGEDRPHLRRHSRVRVDQLLPRRRIGSVPRHLRGLHQLLQVCDRALKTLRRLGGRSADAAQHFAQHRASRLHRSIRVPRDRGIRVLQHRIHHSLVRGDLRFAAHHRFRKDRVDVLLRILVPLVGGVLTDQPGLILPMLVVLVPVVRHELRNREVAAQHPGIALRHQRVERERPEHLDERLPVAQRAHIEIPGPQLRLGVQDLPVPLLQLVRLHLEQELRQRDNVLCHLVMRLGAFIPFQHHIRHTEVRQHRQRSPAAGWQLPGLTRHHPHQMAHHVSRQLVAGVQPFNRRRRVLAGHRLVQLHHLTGGGPLLRLGAQLGGVEICVVQLLVLAEHVRPEDVQEHFLHHGRGLREPPLMTLVRQHNRQRAVRLQRLPLRDV